MTATTWEFHLHQSHILTANDRPNHWGGPGKTKKILRNLGKTHHRIHSLPHLERVRMNFMVSYPRRIARDAGNLYPTLKSYVDGLVNGTGEEGDPLNTITTGLLPDDNDIYLDGPFIEWSGEASIRKDHYRFDVTLTPLAPRLLDPFATAPKAYRIEMERRASVGIPTG